MKPVTAMPTKAPEVAAHDRAVAGGLASLVFVAVVVALVLVLRRLRARIALEHAERVLEREIDALVPEED